MTYLIHRLEDTKLIMSAVDIIDEVSFNRAFCVEKIYRKWYTNTQRLFRRNA